MNKFNCILIAEDALFRWKRTGEFESLAKQLSEATQAAMDDQASKWPVGCSIGCIVRVGDVTINVNENLSGSLVDSRRVGIAEHEGKQIVVTLGRSPMGVQ